MPSGWSAIAVPHPATRGVAASSTAGARPGSRQRRAVARRPSGPRRPAVAVGPARCRRSTWSISTASAGASRRLPARSWCSTSGPPGACRAGSRCRRWRRWRRDEARDGVVVAAVNYLEPAAKIRGYLERAPFEPPILLDSDGDATVAWTPRVFPTTVLIGRDGRPALTVVGELDWQGDEAKSLLEPLVAARRKA